MGNNTGYAECAHCGAEYRLFTIFNRDMMALCKIWRRRHERGCAKRTPEQRRKWAAKYVGLDSSESSIVVDLDHIGFAIDGLVSCIHCAGSKTDPCDDEEKPCYLCAGRGLISEDLKQRTITEAETPSYPPVFSF